MRRLISLITILVLLGLSTTVLVAWFYAAMIHPVFTTNRFSKWSSSSSEEVDDLYIREWRGTGKRAAVVFAIDEHGVPNELRIDDARGWPFLSLRSSWQGWNRAFVHPNERVRGGLAIKALDQDWVLDRPSIWFPHTPDMVFVTMERHRALPLIPVWPGLIGSTLGFSLAWSIVLLLITSPPTLRRVWRRRRNHCIRCAYALHGITSERCPECGWSIAQRMAFLTNGRIATAIVLCCLVLGGTAVFGGWLVWRADHPGQLHLAARNNDVAAIERLLTAGADVDQPSEHAGHHYREYSSPLTWAAAHGNLDAMRSLINAGADVNRDTIFDLWPPLGVAIDHSQYDAVKLLLDAGGDKWLLKDDGAHAVLVAACQPELEILRLVIETLQRSAVTVESRRGPIACAIARGHIGNVRLLIEAGFSVRYDDLVAVAIRGGYTEIAQLLLEAGADPHGADAGSE